MKLKKSSYVVLAFLLAYNIVILTSNSVYGKSNESLTGEITCKWQGDTCPSGNTREVCLKDGTGNTCTCGDVTRSC